MSDEFSAVFKGEVKSFKVVKPKLAETREAQKVYNTVYNDAINSNAILRQKLESVMRKQGLWNDELQTQLVTLRKDISDLEYKLKTKGIKLSQAKEYALKIIDLRNEMTKILAERQAMDSNTAESQAENMQFNYFVSACTVYNDGNDTKVFNSLDEFLTSDEDDLIGKASRKFMEMRYGIISADDDLPEYKFLKKYKFVDQDLRLINKDGKLVDRQGRLVNEFGQYIDEEGNLVDKEGRRLDENGDYLESDNFFLDDDGNPIVEESPEDSVKEETVENEAETT